MNESRLTLHVGGLVALLATGVAQATLLVQEGFDYSLVSPINSTQTNGVGFAALSSWGSVNANIVAGLTFNGYATAGSNAFQVTAGTRIERALASSFGGSTFYVSMLINNYGVNDPRFGVELRNGNGPCLGRVNNGWGFFGGTSGLGGISNTNGAYQTWTGVTAAADSLTHLIIFKFDYAAQAIKLFVDPLPALGEQTPSATLVTGGAWTIALNSQLWTAIAAFRGGVANETLDEVRIGTTWADVAPADPVAMTTDSWWTNVLTGAVSSWGDANNWVNTAGANALPGPGSANFTMAGASYTALYDSVQPAISNLLIQNTAPYRSDLIVSAPLTSLGGAAIRLLSGSSMTITNGGIWNYVGANGATDKNESMLSIRNGGELNITGGTVAFTNLVRGSTAYGNYINVGYSSTGILRVASGRLEYYERGARASTNDERSLRIGRSAGGVGTLEIGSGGSVVLGKVNGAIGAEPLQVGVGSDTSGARGSVIISGGSLVYTNQNGNTLMVGSYYGIGSFIVTNNGYVNLKAGGSDARAYVGQTPYGNGLLRMDGGYMTVGDGLNVGYNSGYTQSATGLVEVTAGTLEAGAGLVIGMSQTTAGFAVGSVNIYGGRVTQGYWGVFVGRSQTGGNGYGRMTITNGLLDIISTAGVGTTRWAGTYSGLAIGVINLDDNNVNSRAQGEVLVSGSGTITNSGVLAIGVNSATGTLTQTGGRIVHVPGSNTDRLTIIAYGNCTNSYAGGGNGTYEMSGGSYYTPNRAFVGGVPTNVQFYSRSGGVGLLKVTGGSFTVTNNTLMVGGNGAGTLVLGSNGVCFAKDIVLTNNTQSTLRCELGTEGLGTLTASSNLVICTGAKLEVNTTAYQGKAVWVKLADCVTRTGSFDPANITITGKGEVKQNRSSDQDVWLFFRRGTMIGIL